MCEFSEKEWSFGILSGGLNWALRIQALCRHLARILQASLGGNNELFNVIRLGDRVFSFIPCDHMSAIFSKFIFIFGAMVVLKRFGNLISGLKKKILDGHLFRGKGNRQVDLMRRLQNLVTNFFLQGQMLY